MLSTILIAFAAFCYVASSDGEPISPGEDQLGCDDGYTAAYNMYDQLLDGDETMFVLTNKLSDLAMPFTYDLPFAINECQVLGAEMSFMFTCNSDLLPERTDFDNGECDGNGTLSSTEIATNNTDISQFNCDPPTSGFVPLVMTLEVHLFDETILAGVEEFSMDVDHYCNGTLEEEMFTFNVAIARCDIETDLPYGIPRCTTYNNAGNAQDTYGSLVASGGNSTCTDPELEDEKVVESSSAILFTYLPAHLVNATSDLMLSELLIQEEDCFIIYPCTFCTYPFFGMTVAGCTYEVECVEDAIDTTTATPGGEDDAAHELSMTHAFMACFVVTLISLVYS